MLFTCPRTGKEVRIPAGVLGKSFECPSCGQIHLAPVPEARGASETTQADAPADAAGGGTPADAGPPEAGEQAAREAIGASMPEPPPRPSPPDEKPDQVPEERPDERPAAAPPGPPAAPPPQGSTSPADASPPAQADLPGEVASAMTGPPAPPVPGTVAKPPPSSEAAAEPPRDATPDAEAPPPPAADMPEPPAAVAGGAGDAEDEDTVPTPPAGLAVAEPPVPAPSRRGGRVVVLLLVLAAMGAGGYFARRYVVMMQTRAALMSAMSDTEDAHAAGRFSEAVDLAARAEAILGDRAWVFTPEELARYRDRLGRHRRALEVYTLARDAAARAPSGFETALAELDRIASAPPASDDAALGQAVARLRAQCALDEAARIAGVEAGEAADLDRAIIALNALRRRVASGPDAERLGGIVSAFLERERKRAHEAALAGAKEAVELLAGDKARDALERATKAEADLVALPREIGSPALEKYLALVAKVAEGEAGALPGVAETDLAAAAQLFKLRAIVREAADVAETGPSDPGAALKRLGELRARALEAKGAVPDVEKEAERAIQRLEGGLRALERRFDAARRAAGEDPGAFLEASVINMAKSTARVRLLAARIERDADRFRAAFRVDGLAGTLEGDRATWGGAARLVVEGYVFRVPREHLRHRAALFAAAVAPRMREAGVDPGFLAEWEMVDGPGVPVARGTSGARTFCFVEGELAEVRWEEGADRAAIDDFTTVARELRKSIKSDESIESDLRLCFDATLAATFGETDPRDWLEPAFCRRIVAEGYLEESVPDLGDAHRGTLKRYRAAYAKLAAGYPAFSLALAGGRTLTAFGSLEDEIAVGEARRSGERATYSWREDSGGDGAKARTTFVAPLPGRGLHPLYVAATFEGAHESQPDVRLPGADAGLEVVRLSMEHVTAGTLASKKRDAWELEFDQERWDRVLDDDFGRFRNLVYGTPGWALPPHVPVLDAHGTARAILARRGLVLSPDFGEIADAAARRAAEERYLDECAAKLLTPGELGFLFKYLTKYVYDSPVASQPELLGNHLAMGETHQTAEQFLERKIGGYFVGDCDDVAEFYQVITRRQGKLSHVFSLPKHAACGYVEKREPPPGEDFELIFLQTGPPLTFKGKTLDEVVEKGVMHFSEDEEQTFTVASVGFLFRFANEQTRTPYVLSDRIIVDEKYADIMIRVQSYWHYHYYATAIRVMEDLFEHDKDISNFMELAGLYNFVGLYEKSVEMSRAGLDAMKRSDEKIRQKELVDIATIHYKAGDDLEARKVLLDIMERTAADLKARNFQQVFRLMPVRFMAAGLYAMLDEPLAAFGLVREDVGLTQRFMGKIPDPLRRTLVGIYGAVRRKEEKGGSLSAEEVELRDVLARLVPRDFASDLFQEDDGFNTLLGNYSLVGSYAAATAGRAKARDMLLAEGPYPDGTRDHRARGPEITPEDWEWFRICPPLYMQLAREVSDPVDAPHRWTPAPRLREAREFDPALAGRLVDAMLRGADAGRRLGSMNSMEGMLLRGRMLRAILRSDVEGFDRILAEVKGKNWDRLFEDASTAFGDLMGLLRLEDVPAWMDVFHKYVPGKQHYFRIAYWALDEGYYDHGLAAGERAVTYFPDEEAMAGELVYMRELVKQLKGLAVERAKRQGRDVPERDLTAPPALEPAAGPSAGPADAPVAAPVQ